MLLKLVLQVRVFIYEDLKILECNPANCDFFKRATSACPTLVREQGKFSEEVANFKLVKLLEFDFWEILFKRDLFCRAYTILGFYFRILLKVSFLCGVDHFFLIVVEVLKLLSWFSENLDDSVNNEVESVGQRILLDDCLLCQKEFDFRNSDQMREQVRIFFDLQRHLLYSFICLLQVDLPSNWLVQYFVNRVIVNHVHFHLFVVVVCALDVDLLRQLSVLQDVLQFIKLLCFLRVGKECICHQVRKLRSYKAESSWS